MRLARAGTVMESADRPDPVKGCGVFPTAQGRQCRQAKGWPTNGLGKTFSWCRNPTVELAEKASRGNRSAFVIGLSFGSQRSQSPPLVA
ncbi:MAG: hypothetical protein EBS42_14735 [Caulobacteraceae bacterium]|nr:hypothetical protein [Caulobacteraceae bacterium]